MIWKVEKVKDAEIQMCRAGNLDGSTALVPKAYGISFPEALTRTLQSKGCLSFANDQCTLVTIVPFTCYLVNFNFNLSLDFSNARGGMWTISLS